MVSLETLVFASERGEKPVDSTCPLLNNIADIEPPSRLLRQTHNNIF